MSENEKNQHDDDEIPFREMKLSSKLLVILVISLLVILAIGFVFGIYFFGLAGAMNMLGVQYDSTRSLFMFVLALFIVGIIVEIVGKIVYIGLTLKVHDKTKLFMIRLMVETFSGWLVLFTVDEFMTSITIPPITEFILALLMALIEAALDRDYAKKP